jgi:hypothetical protein
MSVATRSPQPEHSLARLLSAGTSAACAIIAAGMLLHLCGYGHAALWLESSGVGAFVLLPVLRLIYLCWAFRRQRDSLFAALCLLILLIIGLGVAAGLHAYG